MRASSIVSALVGVAVTALALDARASGLYVGDLGTRGMSRGGAFVAKPDSVLAIHYNPAGLSLLRGLHIEFSDTVVDLNELFERTCPCVSPNVENAADLDRALEASFRQSSGRSNNLLHIPFFGMSYGLPFSNLTIAFAAYGPHAGKSSFGSLKSSPSDGQTFLDEARATPYRYSVLKTDPIEVDVSLAAGIQLIPQVRLGAGLIGYYLGFNQTRHAWANADLRQTPEDPIFDVPISLSFKSKPSLNWIVGISVDIMENLSFGSSLRWGRKIKAKGKLEATLPNLLIDPETGAGIMGSAITGDDVEVQLSTAPLWRAGLELSLPDLLRLEAAVVYEGWSVQDAIRIETKNVKVNVLGQEQELSSFEIPRRWIDTFSFRLGGELKAIDPYLTLRAGYFFEPSAIPARYLEPGQLDRPKHGFSVGIGTELLGFELDVGAAMIYLRPLRVENSAIQAVGPLSPPLGSSDRITTVGNGLYQGLFLLGSLSIARSFDL